VFPRAAKSVPVSPQIRAALGLDPGTVRMTPAELMKSILLAPVDLFWNGGIGTYVKASTETHADVGDKANDAIRVNGQDLRVPGVERGCKRRRPQPSQRKARATAGRASTGHSQCSR